MPLAGGRSRVPTKRHSRSERLLIIDASLSSKVASRLRERGREAKSLNELDLRTALDPQVVEAVFGLYPDAVLVTYDDRMPEEHPVVIERHRATVATIEPWDRKKRAPLFGHDVLADDELWKREVTHRWAHEMALQERGSIWRYDREKRRKWTPNIRNPQGKLFKTK